MLYSSLLRCGATRPGRVLLLLFFLAAATAQAQGPSDGGPAPSGAPAIETPIDGGASALLAAGGLWPAPPAPAADAALKWPGGPIRFHHTF